MLHKSNLISKVVDTYGGESFWKGLKSIETVVSANGLAFVLKGRPFFNHSFVSMDVQSPYCRIAPIGKDDSITGILDGESVRTENQNGNVLAQRNDPRQFFPYGRRLFKWDDLDMSYFANYAFWNYFTFPLLLMNSSIRWTQKKNHLLEAVFPDSIPTHSRIQQFYINPNTGLLQKHHYTASIIGDWAKAVHIVKGHSKFEGINVPTDRIVKPRLKNGNPMAGPVLIRIKVHEVRWVT